jgi:hypothetical protein
MFCYISILLSIESIKVLLFFSFSLLSQFLLLTFYSFLILFSEYNISFYVYFKFTCILSYCIRIRSEFVSGFKRKLKKGTEIRKLRREAVLQLFPDTSFVFLEF